MATKKNQNLTVSSVALKDLRKLVTDSVKNLNRDSIKGLVNTYYDIQEYRIKIENRIRAAKSSNEEPEDIKEENELLFSFDENNKIIFNDSASLTVVADMVLSSGLKDLEEFIKKALTVYVDNDPVGQWLTSITGIGPVIAAGLLSYIDISRCKTAGCIWSYAGITGTEVKKKGEKLNYSTSFKTLCWKIGESFVKTSNNDKDIYGHLYKEKKEWYIKKNSEGGFADAAKKELESKKVSKESQLYKTLSEGKLSDAHINAMAKRFAVKIFLSHLFEVWYEFYNGEKPPKPFVEAHLNHVHIMSAPNRDILFK